MATPGALRFCYLISVVAVLVYVTLGEFQLEKCEFNRGRDLSVIILNNDPNELVSFPEYFNRHTFLTHL